MGQLSRNCCNQTHDLSFVHVKNMLLVDSCSIHSDCVPVHYFELNFGVSKAGRLRPTYYFRALLLDESHVRSHAIIPFYLGCTTAGPSMMKESVQELMRVSLGWLTWRRR